MKLQTEIITLCDYATVSQDNKLSIVGIFDEFRVLNLPAAITRAFLVATVKGLPERSYKLTFKIENDRNSKTTLKPLHLDIHTSPNGKHNLLIELANVGFYKEGEYRCVLYHGDNEIGSTAIKVIHIKQKQQTVVKLPN